LELIYLPLILGLLSFFVPAGVIRHYGLLGSLALLGIVLARTFVFDPATTHYILNPGKVFPLGLTFKMGYDALGLLMLILTNVTMPLILLSNYNRPLANNQLFHALAFFMLFGLNGIFLSLDGMLFYVFWELTLVPILMILYFFGDKNNNTVLFRFFLFTFAGSLAMLMSFFALGNYAGSFDYEALLAVELSPQIATLVMIGFLLAFAVKIPLFPFHSWQPSTYTSSPMAGTMLLSAIMLKMALFGMIKWMIPLSVEVLQLTSWIIIILSVIGIVYGAIIAIGQYDLKVLFAYASLSHLGIITAGIAVFNEEALFGACIQMLNHSLLSVGMFLVADILEQRLKSKNLRDMGGIAKLAPSFGFWFAVITLASVSVPFSAGFIGEFIILYEIFNYDLVMGILSASTLVFGAVFMLRAFQLSMFGFPKIDSFKDLTLNELAVFLLIGAMILLLGVYPQMLKDFLEPCLNNIVNSLNSKVQ